MSVTGIMLAAGHKYGALGIAMGAALEGEAAVTLGGALAHQGVFSPVACAAAAAGGSFLADQSVFWLAASRRETAFVRKIAAKPAFARALGWIDRNALLFCLAFRFLYGLRIAGPAALAVSRLRFRTFVALNLLSAVVWGAVFTYIGYRFGPAALRLAAKALHSPNAALIAGAAGALAMAIAAGLIWRKRRAKAHALTDQRGPCPG